MADHPAPIFLTRAQREALQDAINESPQVEQLGSAFAALRDPASSVPGDAVERMAEVIPHATEVARSIAQAVLDALLRGDDDA